MNKRLLVTCYYINFLKLFFLANKYFCIYRSIIGYRFRAENFLLCIKFGLFNAYKYINVYFPN